MKAKTTVLAIALAMAESKEQIVPSSRRAQLRTQTTTPDIKVDNSPASSVAPTLIPTMGGSGSSLPPLPDPVASEDNKKIPINRKIVGASMAIAAFLYLLFGRQENRDSENQEPARQQSTSTIANEGTVPTVATNLQALAVGVNPASNENRRRGSNSNNNSTNQQRRSSSPGR